MYYKKKTADLYNFPQLYIVLEWKTNTLRETWTVKKINYLLKKLNFINYIKIITRKTFDNIIQCNSIHNTYVAHDAEHNKKVKVLTIIFF